MRELNIFNLHTTHQETDMVGYYCCPAEYDQPLPGILLVHGAAGLNDQMMANARHLAAQGYAVLAVDLWGQRRVLTRPPEFAEMISAMLSRREMWMGRLNAARQSLTARPEVNNGHIGAVGFCFGGTSVLDFIRTGHGLDAAVSLHGGIDNVGRDWSRATADARVLILSGANDLMATAEDLVRLQQGMNGRGIKWEQTLYGQTRHAFTEPDHAHTPSFAKYDAIADHRAWQSALSFLDGVFFPRRATPVVAAEQGE